MRLAWTSWGLSSRPQQPDMVGDVEWSQAPVRAGAGARRLLGLHVARFPDDLLCDRRRIGEHLYPGHVSDLCAGWSRYQDQLAIAHGVVNRGGSFTATGCRLVCSGVKAPRLPTRSQATMKAWSTTGVPQAVRSRSEDVTVYRCQLRAAYVSTTHNQT